MIYTPKGEIEKRPLYENEASAVTRDTEYNMQFNNTAMNDIAEKIGRKFNVEVRISDKHAGRCRVTADFTDHSLESTLQLITEVLDLSFSHQGSIVTITGTGCK